MYTINEKELTPIIIDSLIFTINHSKSINKVHITGAKTLFNPLLPNFIIGIKEKTIFMDTDGFGLSNTELIKSIAPHLTVVNIIRYAYFDNHIDLNLYDLTIKTAIQMLHNCNVSVCIKLQLDKKGPIHNTNRKDRIIRYSKDVINVNDIEFIELNPKDKNFISAKTLFPELNNIKPIAEEEYTCLYKLNSYTGINVYVRTRKVGIDFSDTNKYISDIKHIIHTDNSENKNDRVYGVLRHPEKPVSKMVESLRKHLNETPIEILQQEWNEVTGDALVDSTKSIDAVALLEQILNEELYKSVNKVNVAKHIGELSKYTWKPTYKMHPVPDPIPSDIYYSSTLSDYRFISRNPVYPT